jgi:hypothetical protein
VRATDDLDGDAVLLLEARGAFAGVTAVDEELRDRRELLLRLGEDELGAVAVLYAGAMDDDCDQVAARIGDEVPLAAFDLLARVITMDPPLSDVLTD